MTRKESTYQPGLWTDEPVSLDPEKKLHQLGTQLNSRYYHYLKETPIIDEIKAKRSQLRKLIGLPIVRGNNPHVNDRFYKYLVKKIYKFDTFGIFREYDRVLNEVSPELDLKIKQVGGLIDELLNRDLNRSQKYEKFNHFVNDYQQTWNTP